MAGGERIGRVAGDQHVWAVLEHRAGDGDRLPRAAHERRGAGGTVRTSHHRRRHLGHAVRAQRRATSGVEELALVLHVLDRGLHGIDRRSAGPLEDRATAVDGLEQRCLHLRLSLAAPRRPRTGAGVDHEHRPRGAHRAAIARPAARPEKMQPPRKVPSSAL